MQNQLETLKMIIETDIDWFTIQIKSSVEMKDYPREQWYQAKKNIAENYLNLLNNINQ
jgi:hypothetical protein